MDKTKLANITTIKDLFLSPFYMVTSDNQMFFVSNRDSDKDDHYCYMYNNTPPIIF